MTLRYYYKNNDGDVVEIVNPSRIRRTGTEASYQAEEGAVGTWDLEVDDPDGTFNVRGFRIVYAQETDAIGDAQHGIIGVWFTGERYVSRMSGESPDKRTGRGRTWRIQLHDLNTRLSWRLNVGNDCKRPAETDLARIAWLMSTAEMNWLDNDTTYIDTTAAVQMDAVDYTGQALLDVADDCAQQSGRAYGILWEYSGDEDDPIAAKLWYKFAASTDYSSDRRINNIIAETEADPDILYPSLDATLNRSPSRVASGVYQTYDGGAVYQTLGTTTTRFNRIDVVGRGENVKTAAQATYRANRYLGTVSNVETDRIEVSVIVLPEDVNSILPFHRIQVHFTHLPGYQGEADDEYFWMRVVERTVRDRDIYHYELGLTLMASALEEFDDTGGGSGGGGGGSVYALLIGPAGPFGGTLGSGSVEWAQTGDETLIPSLATQGPFTFTAATSDPRHPYAGIEITDTGTVDVSYVASACGITGVGTHTITWELLLNGGTVASATFTWVKPEGLFFFGYWGETVSIAGLDVTAGDVLTTKITGPPSDYFRVPWGVNPGVNNNRLEITGGSF